MRTLLATLVLFGLAEVPGKGDPVEVTILVENADSAEPASPVRVRFSPELTGGEKSSPPAIEERIEVGRSATIRLPGGLLWAIRAQSEGVWSPEVILNPSEQATARLLLFPTATVRAPVEVRRFGEVPERLEVGFEPVQEGLRSREQPRGVVDCPVAEGVAECVLPAADLDLRFSAAPYAPVYRLGVELAAGKLQLVETLELVEGSSISGFVLDERGSPAAAGTRVRLTLPGDARPEAEPGLRILTATTETDRRGFFQFLSVRPGHYRIVADASGFAPASIEPVEARPGLEAALVDALVLARPASLTVELLPQRDPWGGSWTLRLTRSEPGTERRLGSIESAATLEGTWTGEDLSPGSYWLTVSDSRSNQWIHQPVEVLRNQDPLLVQVPVIEIDGTVTRGGEPAPGSVWFGGTDRVRRIQVKVGEDGSFSGFLPEAGEWPIDWISATPPATELSLAPVEVPDETRVSLEIEIPDTEIEGEVVDENGDPVAGAGVSLRHLERRGTGGDVEADEAGRFSILGLSPGPYAVEARAGEATSDQVQMTLEEGRELPDLRLVIRSTTDMAGRVHSSGRGVPGARILAWPDLGSAPGFSFLETVSGPDGLFRIEAPSSVGALNFLVVAPGFSVSLGRSAVSSHDLVDLHLDSYGGAVTIDRGEGEGTAFLVREGSFLPVDAFAHLVGRSALRDPSEPGVLVLQNLEPGTYALCAGRSAMSSIRGAGEPPEGGCAVGVLPPFGELRLRLDGPKDREPDPSG